MSFALLVLDGNARLGCPEKESLPEIDFFPPNAAFHRDRMT
jgi:hypothetical protein